MGASAIGSLHDSFAACRGQRASIAPFPHRFRAARKESVADGRLGGEHASGESSTAKAVADAERLQTAMKAAMGDDERKPHPLVRKDSESCEC